MGLAIGDALGNTSEGMLPQARLMDYYSVRTADVLKELKMEVHRVIALPEGWEDIAAVKVESLTSGGRDLPAGECQWAIEQTLDGRLLHVRIPIDAPIFGSTWQMWITQKGLSATLVVTRK